MHANNDKINLERCMQCVLIGLLEKSIPDQLIPLPFTVNHFGKNQKSLSPPLCYWLLPSFLFILG